MSKKVVMVVASLAAIAACAWYMWPKGTAVSREQLMQPYVCEACDHHFRAVPGTDAVECPECHKKTAVRCHEYECAACGARFEAFRERQGGEDDGPPVMEYKRPGGQWLRSPELLGKITCPKCKSDKVHDARPKPTTK